MAQSFKIAQQFQFEHELAQKGFTQIAGVDEAGRGPLAGPVVAAALIFPIDWVSRELPDKLKKVNDSKQLKEKDREILFAELMLHAEIRHAVAVVDAPMIDQINILQATHRAMNLALAQLNPAPQHALVDGLRVKTLTFPQTAIVKGDSLSYSIAAASILAKVTRDRMMLEYHDLYPAYSFREHKGYGTAKHLAALQKHGPCPIHRMTFAPVRAVQTEFFNQHGTLVED